MHGEQTRRTPLSRGGCLFSSLLLKQAAGEGKREAEHMVVVSLQLAEAYISFGLNGRRWVAFQWL